jgi:hypothetical protein
MLDSKQLEELNARIWNATHSYFIYPIDGDMRALLYRGRDIPCTPSGDIVSDYDFRRAENVELAEVRAGEQIYSHEVRR